jgi:riboflavin kinase/FMN adenylyltransferase
MSGSVVAVGVFDGLHRGHAELFTRARALAGAGRCVAVSFDPHPDIVLAKEFRALAPLTPLPEKHERLAAAGIELHVLPFTRELAALSPEAFVETHLVAPFAPRVLVVGADFALGRGRAGDVPRLSEIGRSHGFEVVPVPLAAVDGGPVTSTRIRDALANGEVTRAARLLGRWYGLAGSVVHGEKVGRTLGYPTANLRLHEEKQVPALGIYAVWARIAGEAVWRPAAMSIGIRPTFGGQVRTLEVFLLDWSGDLYGRTLEVRFAHHLRPERHFADIPALVEQMGRDVADSRRVLGELDPERPPTA